MVQSKASTSTVAICFFFILHIICKFMKNLFINIKVWKERFNLIEKKNE